MDNGAGARQFQLFSPVDVFLGDNENVRLLWSPLFAIYRYDQPARGSGGTPSSFASSLGSVSPATPSFTSADLRVEHSSGSAGIGAGRVAVAGGLAGFAGPTPAGGPSGSIFPENN